MEAILRWLFCLLFMADGNWVYEEANFRMKTVITREPIGRRILFNILEKMEIVDDSDKEFFLVVYHNGIYGEITEDEHINQLIYKLKTNYFIPYMEDANILPSPVVVDATLRFYSMEMNYFYNVAALAGGWKAQQCQNIIRTYDYYCDIFRTIRNIRETGNIWFKREQLKYLRDLVGPRIYYAGQSSAINIK